MRSVLRLVCVVILLHPLAACVECGENQVRRGNECVLLCNVDDDCAGSESCVNGECAPTAGAASSGGTPASSSGIDVTSSLLGGTSSGAGSGATTGSTAASSGGPASAAGSTGSRGAPGSTATTSSATSGASVHGSSTSGITSSSASSSSSGGQPSSSGGGCVVAACPPPEEPCRVAVCVEGACAGELLAEGMPCADGKHCSAVGDCVPSCVIDGALVLPGTPSPDNACLGCQPVVSTTTFTMLPDDTPCDRGAFCEQGATCAAGACQGGTSPCDATQPFCSEAAAACFCTFTSCDDGRFCNGAETCGTAGLCETGTAPSCGDDTPICSDGAGRCVACAGDEDCATPNPSCVNFTCTACPTCPCPLGEHDGGDGSCVPEGTCVSGFALAYADEDADGVGTGLQLPDCYALPLAVGLAATGMDCAPQDGNAYELRTLHRDLDGDGYTAAPVEVCVGASIPATYRETAAPPPFLSFEAAASAEIEGNGRDWDNDGAARGITGSSAQCELSSNTACRPLQILGLAGLDVPADAVIRGLRIRVRKQARNGSVWNTNPAYAKDVSVNLVMGGVVVGENRALPDRWPATLSDVFYGGPTDTWGVPLTAADVTAPDFGLQIVVVGEEDPANDPQAFVDGIHAEVFTDQGDDANDEDPGVFRIKELRVDGDGDGYVAGSTLVPVGALLPPGFAELGLGDDCYDSNANARPGNATYYSAHRGDGSFDYNCDGVTTRQSVSQATACACSVTATCDTTLGSYVPSGSCGTQTGDAVCSGECTTPTCALTSTTSTIRCR